MTKTERNAINPFDPAFLSDPYATYAALREQAAFVNAFGSIVLLRHADVSAALRDTALGVGLIPDVVADKVQSYGLTNCDKMVRFMRGSIVFSDEPTHSRLRRLVGAAYGPDTIAELRRIVCNETNRLLDRTDERASIDLVRDFAALLPTAVIATALGIGEENHEFIRGTIHRIRSLLDPGLLTRKGVEEARDAFVALATFFEVQTAPDNAETSVLLSSLRGAKRGFGDRLGSEEIAFAAIMSFVAGTETTQSLIATLLHLLTQQPDLLSRLRSSPDTIGRVVDECLRLESPLQFTKRIAKADTDVNGIFIPKGSHVLICLGAANRDPSAFVDPDDFNPMRAPTGCALGLGQHSCLGGRIARVIAEETVIAFSTRYSSLVPIDTLPQWQSGSALLRSLRALPVRVTRAVVADE